LYAELKDVELVDEHKMHHLEQLFKTFGIVINAVDPQAMIQQYKIKIQNLKDRYPMLKHLSSYSATVSDVVDYINMVDQVKGN
jgi:uncharacterized protein YqgQ